jgi:hypothetical protein
LYHVQVPCLKRAALYVDTTTDLCDKFNIVLRNKMYESDVKSMIEIEGYFSSKEKNDA